MTSDIWEKRLALLDRIYITGLNILVCRGDSAVNHGPDPWKPFLALWEHFTESLAGHGWLPEADHPLHGRLLEKIHDVRGLMSSLEKCCRENMEQILTALPQLRTDNKRYQSGQSEMIAFKS